MGEYCVLSNLRICRKLIDRVDNLKIRATGNGVTQCLLCGADFGLLATYAAMCVHCRKYVCQKNCGTVTTDPVKRETQFSCKICTEQKEVGYCTG